MELGNAVFGNSRGEYPIERGVGWEKQLHRIFDVICPGNYRGEEFDNNVFSVFPYYWGDCTCGYDEKEGEFSETVWHAEECYQSEYKKISHYNQWNNHDKWIEKHIKPLYQKFGFETKSETWWHGCAVRCTCDYEKKWEVFLSNNSHDKNCPIVKPNFLFKPTGFSIKWYKYPLRDSYMSQNITLNEFAEIINQCVDSCTAFQHSVQRTASTPRRTKSNPEAVKVRKSRRR